MASAATDGMHRLHLALKHKATDSIVAALIAAHPDSLAQKSPDDNCTALHLALKFGASDAIVNMWSNCSSIADARHKNVLCFTLVEKGASIYATNAEGRTPAEVLLLAPEKRPGQMDLRKLTQKELRSIMMEDFEVKQDDIIGLRRFPLVGRVRECSINLTQRPAMIRGRWHIDSTFREIALFKVHAHLSWMHSRDWTTVSHAWCTPSAKLTALTVLLVGETYKRTLLPRLPMDCWYRILNCIPRHELRQGYCDPESEKAAQEECTAILQEAAGKSAPVSPPQPRL